MKCWVLYESLVVFSICIVCWAAAHEPRRRAPPRPRTDAPAPTMRHRARNHPVKLVTKGHEPAVTMKAAHNEQPAIREPQHDGFDVIHAEGDKHAPVVDHLGPPGHSHRSEFTFDLPARTTSCFGEHFHAEFRNYTFEYKRVRGDGAAQVTVRDHTDTVIYDKADTEWDLINFLTVPGDFTFCFNSKNYVGGDQTMFYMRLDESNEHAKLRSQFGPGAPEMRSSLCESISTQLVKVSGEQKHWRLESEDGRAYADSLHSRLAFWTVFATIGLTLVNIGQTFALKQIFQTVKVPRQSLQAERAYRMGSVDSSAYEDFDRQPIQGSSFY